MQRSAALGRSMGRSHGGVVGNLIHTLRVWVERSQQRDALARLDPRVLNDIGLSEIQRAEECEKPFWKA